MNFDFYNSKEEMRIELKEKMDCSLIEAIDKFIEQGVTEKELGIYVLAFLKKGIVWKELSDAGDVAIDKGDIRLDLTQNCDKFGADETGLNLSIETKMFIVNCYCDVHDYASEQDVCNFHEDIFEEYYYRNLNVNSGGKVEKELKELGILIDEFTKKDCNDFDSNWYTLSLNVLVEVMGKINFLDELDLS